MNLELRRPSVVLQETFLAGLDELETDGDRSAWVCLGAAAPRDVSGRDFASYVRMVLNREHAAATGFVTDTVYWAIREGEMLGRISLRHELNEFLLCEGGHIGYIVRPSVRKQGVATEMLRQILLTEKARSIGRLLLTCDEDNLASERSILKNGGILENVIDVGAGQQRKKRFWISVS
jgi:predicted acetyltransferase